MDSASRFCLTLLAMLPLPLFYSCQCEENRPQFDVIDDCLLMSQKRLYIFDSCFNPEGKKTEPSKEFPTDLQEQYLDVPLNWTKPSPGFKPSCSFAHIFVCSADSRMEFETSLEGCSDEEKARLKRVFVRDSNDEPYSQSVKLEGDILKETISFKRPCVMISRRMMIFLKTTLVSCSGEILVSTKSVSSADALWLQKDILNLYDHGQVMINIKDCDAISETFKPGTE
jgi:hypothetical protein